MTYSLNDINPGQSAVVTSLETTGSMRRRLLDIGIVPDTVVECLGVSPSGDPKAFAVRGAVIALRNADSKKIIISAPAKGGHDK